MTSVSFNRCNNSRIAAGLVALAKYSRNLRTPTRTIRSQYTGLGEYVGITYASTQGPARANLASAHQDGVRRSEGNDDR